MRGPIASAVLALACLASTAAQAADDPFAVRVLYDDVDRFYRVYDAAKGKPTAEQLRRDYIEAGSQGVRDFVPNRIRSPEALAAKIAEDPGLYERARRCRTILPTLERRTRSVYLAFQAVLPEAKLPDTTVLIGAGNSGGTAKAAGVLVGLEVMCDQKPGAWPLEVRLTHLVAHELVHTQQASFGYRGTLLAAALNEGVAEFVGELTSGAPANPELFAWAEPRAAEIERAFAAEMHGNDKSRWLWNGPGAPEWPMDLGYWVGYRIARSFYDRAPDKREAVRTMLRSTDAPAFLKASGWAPSEARAGAPASTSDPGQGPTSANSAAVAATAPTPELLGALVLDRFATGTPETFNQVFAHPEGRRYVANAAANGRRRAAGQARVLSHRGDRAVLLLTGRLADESPGWDTMLGRGFSGLYEARRGPEGWSLARHLPIDADSRIISQDVRVGVRPGAGLQVVTRLEMSADRPEGIVVRLNRTALLESVKLNGRPAEYLFDSSLLWVRSPAVRKATLELRYSIPPGPATSNTLAVGPEHGFIRDQEIWLPVLNYQTEADMARIKVEAEIPAKYQLSVSVPQTETVRDGVRRVTGETTRPAHGVSIGYDEAWSPYEVAVGDARLRAFVTPEFTPRREEIEPAFRWTYDQLTSRFGPPRLKYFGIMQRRSAPWVNWSLLTNNTIVAGRNGGPVRPTTGQYIGAGFGHEMAHAWTRPTGEGRLLLMEGWATLAESYLVGAEHGPEAEQAFWDSYRNHYDRSGFEGRVGIYTDYNNRGVAYSKGAWIFRMLRDRMGEEAFRRGLRSYMDTPTGQQAGVPEFAAAMSRAAGYDVWPLLKPWIEEEVTPDVSASVEGGRLRLVQAGTVFNLPLDVELITPSGPVRRRFDLDVREKAFDIADVGAVSAVRLDPDRRLLMRRPLGEVATFEFTAPAAKKVQLAGDFTAQPLDAQLKDGVWRVSVPLASGFYNWLWIVDGKRPPMTSYDPGTRGTRVVRPLEALETAYPRASGACSNTACV